MERTRAVTKANSWILETLKRRAALGYIIMFFLQASLMLIDVPACMCDQVAVQRPKIAVPSEFDTAAVASLIKNVEAPGNLAVLQVYYFGRRSPHPCPVSQGLSMLQTAVSQEPIGTKRWFCLKTVCGFAGYLVSSDTRDAGGEAYDDIFTHTSQAETSGSVEIAVQAIHDFLVILKSSYGLKAQTGLQGLKQTTLDAFTQYSQFVKADVKISRDISWKEAVTDTYINYEAGKIVSDMLADQKCKKTFLLYKLAADTCSAADAAKSLEYLENAKLLIGHASPDQQKSFYNDYVSVLLALKKPKEAIAMQSELITKTGLGRPRLLMLSWQNNDADQFNETLTELNDPGCPDEDVEGAALVLAYIQGQDVHSGAGAEEVQMLKAYLDSNRVRVPYTELWARYSLAELYIRQNNSSDLKKLLDLPPGLASSPSAIDQFYVKKIRALAAPGLARPTAPGAD